MGRLTIQPSINEAESMRDINCAAEGVGHNSRIDYLDVAKGIGIFIVLFGHLFQYGSAPSKFIFSFICRCSS